MLSGGERGEEGEVVGDSDATQVWCDGEQTGDGIDCALISAMMVPVAKSMRVRKMKLGEGWGCDCSPATEKGGERRRLGRYVELMREGGKHCGSLWRRNLGEMQK